MAEKQGLIRRSVTRALATTVLLGMYVFSTTVVTGFIGSTPSMARGRGALNGGGGRGVRGGGGRGGRGRGGGGRGVGAAIGAGLAVGIIGSAIAADQARRNDCYRFRTYNPETGTYIGRGGVEYPCP